MASAVAPVVKMSSKMATLAGALPLQRNAPLSSLRRSAADKGHRGGVSRRLTHNPAISVDPVIRATEFAILRA